MSITLPAPTSTREVAILTEPLSSKAGGRGGKVQRKPAAVPHSARSLEPWLEVELVQASVRLAVELLDSGQMLSLTAKRST